MATVERGVHPTEIQPGTAVQLGDSSWVTVRRIRGRQPRSFPDEPGAFHVVSADVDGDLERSVLLLEVGDDHRGGLVSS